MTTKVKYPLIDADEPVITANTGASYNMDFSVCQNYILTMTADCDLNVTNGPTQGGSIVLKLVQTSTPRTPTFLINIDNDVPTIPNGDGDYIIFVLSTLDGGTTWIISEVATVEA